MYRYLADELSAARGPGAAMTLMAIDLNKFKQINDRFGQTGGDQAQRNGAAAGLVVSPDDS